MYLDASHPYAIQHYLSRRGWISLDEQVVAVEKPGEGNMNYTLRIRTEKIDGSGWGRSLIMKQARPYVEKYPSIAAPPERALMEGRYYRTTQQMPLLHACQPELLDLDMDNFMLVMQDLGASSDFTNLYQPGVVLTETELSALITYAEILHNQFRQAQPDPTFANRAMRELNHEHIFRFPFRVDHTFDLDAVQPGLQAVSMVYRLDESLKKIITQLGEIYLGETHRGADPTLLHGDYYPGSWLRTPDGVRIIDPEFCFFGPAEFDLGVLMAHLYLSEQPDSLRASALAQYNRPHGFEESLLNQFTGVEIMRRLIGLAQLPLSLSLEKKEKLLILAADLLRSVG